MDNHPAQLPRKNNRNIWEDRKQSVREKVLAACAGLASRGIGIGVNVYAGRLGRVVQGYIAKEDIHLILMCPHGGDRLRSLLRKIGPLAPLFKPPIFSPVLLLHPSQTADRQM